MIVFASTIGLSAFLLFLVQPVVARQILPWFGGSAAVWTTCMVFFQLVLLAGYFYADVLSRHLRPRAQALVHGTLLLVSLTQLPIVPSAAFKPADADNPIGRILVLLAVTIGLPYLMLSTTGPLVQSWFARRFADTPKQASVWRLYALSNAASLAALLGYPTLIEPVATNQAQSLGWSAGYVVFVLLAGASAALVARAPPLPGQPSQAAHGGHGAVVSDMGAPTGTDLGRWLLLSACGSVLLLTVTTHITQNVASVPFLWVLPLALYLTSFILTFDGRGWYWPRSFRVLAGLMAVAMMAGLAYRPNLAWTPQDGVAGLIEQGLMPLQQAVPLYAAGLFVLCMFFHGELVLRKPAPAHLTRFYLMVSAGGALGGLLVGVVAPLLLDWTWELPGVLFLATVVLLAFGQGRWRPAAAVALGACGFFGWQVIGAVHERTVEVSRSFYGTLRVRATSLEDSPTLRWRLLHGVITHGEQYRHEPYRSQPTSYYGASAGVAQALLGLRALQPGRAQHVGLIGLGIGTLASYGREGDRYRFYELDPDVLDVAERRFSYLTDSAARIETQLGDARLMLEREAPQAFDLLAVDAFSSDSIPVHLLTREALATYRRHVAAGGVVAFHISNRYLDLRPVVQQLADEAGLVPWIVMDEPPDDTGLYKSDWVLVTGNQALLSWLARQGAGERLEGTAPIRPWTDDFNNLFDVLR